MSTTEGPWQGGGAPAGDPETGVGPREEEDKEPAQQEERSQEQRLPEREGDEGAGQESAGGAV
jgi:hypothetical protein